VLAYERRAAIMELLENERQASVEALAQRFYVSPSTIRRDLAKIGNGTMRRTYGGAVMLDTRTGDPPMLLRVREHSDAKGRIAQNALQFIHDGAVLMLDPSSTVMALAPLLIQYRDLTVVTNGLQTAYMLNTCGHITTHCTGGRLREHNMAMVGVPTCRRIGELNADVALLSCRGVSAQGVTEASEEEAQVKQAMIASAEKVVLLCDASKVDKVFMNRICDLGVLHALVTDAPLSEEMEITCREAGVMLVYS